VLLAARHRKPRNVCPRQNHILVADAEAAQSEKEAGVNDCGVMETLAGERIYQDLRVVEASPRAADNRRLLQPDQQRAAGMSGFGRDRHRPRREIVEEHRLKCSRDRIGCRVAEYGIRIGADIKILGHHGQPNRRRTRIALSSPTKKRCNHEGGDDPPIDRAHVPSRRIYMESLADSCDPDNARAASSRRCFA
jgi:hypothetical protein